MKADQGNLTTRVAPGQVWHATFMPGAVQYHVLAVYEGFAWVKLFYGATRGHPAEPKTLPVGYFDKWTCVREAT